MSIRPRLTHFLCIPLITPASKLQLANALSRFAQDVKADGVLPEKAIRPVGTLHLTLGVMSLVDKDRINEAVTLLRSIDLGALLHQSQLTPSQSPRHPEAKESQGISITLKGLVSMHNPTSTSILYAPPRPTDVGPASSSSSTTTCPLQEFASLLREKFTRAGFIVPDGRALLLHATIVNTIYAPGVHKHGRSKGHGQAKAKLTFNAIDLIGRYRDFVWMDDVRIEKVAICRMGARKDAYGEERYEVESEVDMPNAVKTSK